jgi:hypothetical protein
MAFIVLRRSRNTRSYPLIEGYRDDRGQALADRPSGVQMQSVVSGGPAQAIAFPKGGAGPPDTIPLN